MEGYAGVTELITYELALYQYTSAGKLVSDEPTGFRKVRGHQVGRLAVRWTGDEPCYSRQDNAIMQLEAAVDHIPSCTSLFGTVSLQEAWCVADEVSRWAPVDLTATSREELDEQLGPRLRGWLTDNARYGDFRRWLRESGQLMTARTPHRAQA